jgi:hypothetical protein
MLGPSLGAAPGPVVAVGRGGLVRKGVDVGSRLWVAVATGEHAASPPSIPIAPIFKASRREIRLFMSVPPKEKPSATWHQSWI